MATTSTNIYFDRSADYELERETYDDGYHDEEANDDYAAILEEYRRKRLIEALIGPVVSTTFHIILIIVLAIFITDKVKEPVSEIAVVMEEVEEIVIEEPPEVQEPEPEVKTGRYYKPCSNYCQN